MSIQIKHIDELLQAKADEITEYYNSGAYEEDEKAFYRQFGLPVPTTTHQPIVNEESFQSEHFVAYNPTRKTFFRFETKSAYMDIGHVDMPDLATKLEYVHPDKPHRPPAYYLPQNCFNPAELDGYRVVKIKITSAITEP